MVLLYVNWLALVDVVGLVWRGFVLCVLLSWYCYVYSENFYEFALMGLFVTFIEEISAEFNESFYMVDFIIILNYLFIYLLIIYQYFNILFLFNLNKIYYYNNMLLYTFFISIN